MDSNLVYQLAYKWQELIGAFIGVSFPILFWFFIRWESERQDVVNNLYFLEKVFVSNINALFEIRETVQGFIDDKLSSGIKNIEIDTKQNVYSIGMVFFPLFYVPKIGTELFSIKTGSAYLDDKIIKLSNMSQDFVLIIEDIRGQLKNTIEFNKELAFSKGNSVRVHNSQYQANLEDYMKMVRSDFIEKTLRVYLKSLVATRITVNEIRMAGLSSWRRRFSSISFKYFRNRQDIKEFRENAFDRIDEALKIEINKEILSLEQRYKNQSS